jgi:hypothetical protein
MGERTPSSRAGRSPDPGSPSWVLLNEIPALASLGRDDGAHLPFVGFADTSPVNGGGLRGGAAP